MANPISILHEKWKLISSKWKPVKVNRVLREIFLLSERYIFTYRFSVDDKKIHEIDSLRLV